MKVYNDFKRGVPYIRVGNDYYVLYFLAIKAFVKKIPQNNSLKLWMKGVCTSQDIKKTETTMLAMINERLITETNFKYYGLQKYVRPMFTRFQTRPSFMWFSVCFYLRDGCIKSKLYSIMFPAIDMDDANYVIEKFIKTNNMEIKKVYHYYGTLYNTAFYEDYEFPYIESFKNEWLNSTKMEHPNIIKR